jgi:hypothetical protein
MAFPLELYPRTCTALVGIVKLGLVQYSGDSALLGISFHLSPSLTAGLPLTMNKTGATQTSQKETVNRPPPRRVA